MKKIRKLNHVRPVAELLLHLLRATGFLGLSTILAEVIIHFAKPSSPQVPATDLVSSVARGAFIFSDIDHPALV